MLWQSDVHCWHGRVIGKVSWQWLSWTYLVLKHVTLVVNGKVPLGPTKGRHMAQRHWFMV